MVCIFLEFYGNKIIWNEGDNYDIFNVNNFIGFRCKVCWDISGVG